MTNKRVQISDNVAGDKELRISRPGFDVDTSDHAEEIAFSSAWDQTVPIHASGIINGYNNAVSFPVLPYIPFAFFYRKDGDKLRRDEMSRIRDSYNNAMGVMPVYAMEVQSYRIRIFRPVDRLKFTYGVGPLRYVDIDPVDPVFVYVILKVKAFDIR